MEKCYWIGLFINYVTNNTCLVLKRLPRWLSPLRPLIILLWKEYISRKIQWELVAIALFRKRGKCCSWRNLWKGLLTLDWPPLPAVFFLQEVAPWRKSRYWKYVRFTSAIQLNSSVYRKLWNMRRKNAERNTFGRKLRLMRKERRKIQTLEPNETRENHVMFSDTCVFIDDCWHWFNESWFLE